MTRRLHGKPALSVLAVLPDRDFAHTVARALTAGGAFRMAAQLDHYPSLEDLRGQLRQVRPGVILLDVVTDLERAARLIEEVSASSVALPVIGLHRANEPAALLRCLRAGASEFLYAPFTPESQQEAAARIERQMTVDPAEPAHRAGLVVFSSAKPGSGASTLAAHTAFALRQATGGRILLADFDLFGGTMRLLFKLPDGPYLPEAPPDPETASEDTLAAGWREQVVVKDGVDILPAPASPIGQTVDPPKLRKLLESARPLYDWLVVDLPSVFERLSLLLLPDADHAFLVSTPELPSLHLARKAVAMLGQLGLSRDQFHVVVNRCGKGDSLTLDGMAKILQAPVYASFPNDYLSLHRALSAGHTLEACALSRAIESFARGIASAREAGSPAAALAARRAV